MYLALLTSVVAYVLVLEVSEWQNEALAQLGERASMLPLPPKHGTTIYELCRAQWASRRPTAIIVILVRMFFSPSCPVPSSRATRVRRDRGCRGWQDRRHRVVNPNELWRDGSLWSTSHESYEH